MGAAVVPSFVVSEVRLWIRDVGFPVVVALILLMRFDSQLTRLVTEFTEATKSLDEIKRLLQPGVRDAFGGCCVVRAGVGGIGWVAALPEFVGGSLVVGEGLGELGGVELGG